MNESFDPQNWIPWFIGVGGFSLASFLFFEIGFNIVILKVRGVLVTGACVAQKGFSSVIRYEGPDGSVREVSIGGGEQWRHVNFGDRLDIVCDPKRPKVASESVLSIPQATLYLVISVAFFAGAVRTAAWPFFG
ncbi:hypothetical protein E6P78_32135 [Streptomyces sp. A0958]|uniref:hypothetical protein n=1 Tax=Streptomyces sp. A0958 TaxID=2563101 RepID=UPI00109EAB3C|nr:hypothetical protein [Streptomyces sp. A0958]THA56486.1 hypothetical protein E6P78_32135 [Streptomyces sp. A0958]